MKCGAIKMPSEQRSKLDERIGKETQVLEDTKNQQIDGNVAGIDPIGFAFLAFRLLLFNQLSADVAA